MTLQPDAAHADAPQRHLGVAHATILALGMIMTTDTLKTAPTVALNIGQWHFYGMWVLGGLLSMIGAMCYVEMATAFPDPGGDYSFLHRTYGPHIGLLFAWSRFSIMHTGWIALMAFMFADYAAALVPISPLVHTLFAMATVAALVGLNLMPVRLGFMTQAALVGLVAVGFAAVVAAALTLGWSHRLTEAASMAIQPQAPSLAKLTVALIYIFLAYGGWSDAATLSAEIRADRRGMLITIIGSIAVLMALYLALNAAMMIGLGAQGLAHSTAPAADLLDHAFGKAGQGLIVTVVGVSAVASINSTLIVGARVTWAASRAIPALHRLAGWHPERGTPVAAIAAVAGFSALLTVLAGMTGNGFGAMVDYMTPVYWVFILLGMSAAIRLRRLAGTVDFPVRTPLFPLFPLTFGAVAVAMVWSSLSELGPGALIGAAVMLTGVVLERLFGQAQSGNWWRRKWWRRKWWSQGGSNS